MIALKIGDVIAGPPIIRITNNTNILDTKEFTGDSIQ
jgi:hypothetical protein